VVNAVVDISAAGRAPKNDPALFVLAMAASPGFADARTNAAALAALPLVARTATHLCTFAEFAQGLRGWGRGLRSAVGHWYVNKPVSELAYQMLKYQNRNGWAHRDLLRLAHPKAADPVQNALFRWAVDGELGDVVPDELAQLQGFELARKASSESEIVRLVEDYRLTQEMVPSKWKTSGAVWEALLNEMPYTAMVRNLGKLTTVGVVAPQSAAAALVVARLIDRNRLKRSKVHPIALLAALLVYKQGRSERGKLRWAPVASVIDALDEAFHLAFDNVQPAGSRMYVAIDASGSMQSSICNGMPFVSAAMGSVALAMVFARTEPNAILAAFHDRIWHVDITRKDRLDRACSAIVREPLGTNAALPFEDALNRSLPIDAFVLMTDSETWAGERHPVQALVQYRKASGIAAKLVVIAMAANRFSIADPNDALQLDVVGFDASVPGVVSNFVSSS
jgi:60 kDa SS-A/Ro ribonucleoprotein